LSECYLRDLFIHSVIYLDIEYHKLYFWYRFHKILKTYRTEVGVWWSGLWSFVCSR